MAIEAPRHTHRLCVIHHRHVIHLTVANGTADPAIHMRGVIVENVIGQAMNPDPLHRLPSFPARAHRLELRIVLLHLLMTRHACLRVRHIRVRRGFNKAVAITTIHPELGHVDIVRERHRLDRLVANFGVFRRDVIPGPGRQSADNHECGDGDFERQPICPARKKVRHKKSADSISPDHLPPTVIRD